MCLDGVVTTFGSPDDTGAGAEEIIGTLDDTGGTLEGVETTGDWASDDATDWVKVIAVLEVCAVELLCVHPVNTMLSAIIIVSRDTHNRFLSPLEINPTGYNFGYLRGSFFIPFSIEEIRLRADFAISLSGNNVKASL